VWDELIKKDVEDVKDLRVMGGSSPKSVGQGRGAERRLMAVVEPKRSREGGVVQSTE
jgi:hypothetical protein